MGEIKKTMQIDQKITERIKSLHRPAVIAISGFGGAGKSTFASFLSEVLGAPVVGVDSFMKDRTLSEYSLWEVMDFRRLEREVLAPFSRSENPLHYGHFDWFANKILETRVLQHQGILVVEGVGLFRPELLKYFSYKIWIDCPIEEATARGMKRDREEYINPQDEMWGGIWKQNDLEYFEKFAPKQATNIIVDNSSGYAVKKVF